MKIAIFLPNWLGDLVMATPALRAIREHWPAAEITGILRPNLAEVLSGSGLVDRQWYFDRRAGDPQLSRRALVQRLRGERFELGVLLIHSFHAALLAALGGVRRRIGYAREGRGLLLTDRVRRPLEGLRLAPEPLVESYRRLTMQLGCPSQSSELHLATTPEEEAAADHVWHTLGLRRTGRVIAINLSAAFGPSKLWPTEHAAELARLIAHGLGDDVLVICGPREEQRAAEVAELAGDRRVFSLAGQRLGIGLTKACLRRCRALVSTDSGPRHVAAAFGVPVVTLLGPTMPIWIENSSVPSLELQLELECVGCRRRNCPLGHHRCMRDLTPERVFDGLTQLIAPRRVRAA